MNRAFSALDGGADRFLGRCPRLGVKSAFGARDMNDRRPISYSLPVGRRNGTPGETGPEPSTLLADDRRRQPISAI
jgi:hypothetical protein